MLCTATTFPTLDRGRDLVCSDHFCLALLLARACFVSLDISFRNHCGLGEYVSLDIGKKSLIGFPNRATAGDTPVDWSGVFRYCMIAFAKLSFCSVPAGPKLPRSRRFILLTPTSALWLEWGLPTDDTLCCTP